MKNIPRVGVGVLVIKNGLVLLGKRKNAHGHNTWNFPGGHLEKNESWEDCARREVAEETGTTIKQIHFITATNDIFVDEGKHYITIFMCAQHKAGVPKILEPNKCETWEWFSWDKFPQPLFLPIKNLRKQGYHPFHNKQ